MGGAGPLYERLRAAGRPLGELAAGAITPALDAALVAALRIDRPTRDRLVIFDPASAHLLRPLALAADVAPWHIGAAGHWVVAVPQAQAESVAGFTALARHLAALSTPAGLSASPWWALAEAEARPRPAPRLVVAGDPPTVAWDETPALIGGPATVIAPAEPYWLALLGSRVGRALLASQVELTAFPIPDGPGPARSGLAGLALQAVALAAGRDELRRAVLRRLVADFGPPGVQPGPLLSRWWTLDFAQLHEAVRSELRNDIPERFRPTWAQIHADERAAHDEAGAHLAELEAAIDAQALALYELDDATFERLAGPQMASGSAL
jgi:hypothetical protein